MFCICLGFVESCGWILMAFCLAFVMHSIW
jgi:hypothetical protein